MFTLNQIHDAHAKVKSGADFPAYIQDLIQLGVTSYSVYVADGHAEYHGANEYHISSPATYEPLEINSTVDQDGFITKLKLHQQGGSDYMTFCRDATQAGIDKRVIMMSDMTCTYLDSNNNSMLVEHIPSL